MRKIYRRSIGKILCGSEIFSKSGNKTEIVLVIVALSFKLKIIVSCAILIFSFFGNKVTAALVFKAANIHRFLIYFRPLAAHIGGITVAHTHDLTPLCGKSKLICRNVTEYAVFVISGNLVNRYSLSVLCDMHGICAKLHALLGGNHLVTQYLVSVFSLD